MTGFNRGQGVPLQRGAARATTNSYKMLYRLIIVEFTGLTFTSVTYFMDFPS